MNMETCEVCGRLLPVEGSLTSEGVRLEFSGMFHGRVWHKQYQDAVAFTTDPFAEEIRCDATELWICESCWYESAMDV